MIIVRNVFVATPGNASKLAAQLKNAAGIGGLPNYRVLTDLTGEFNRVVLEYEASSAAEFEEQLKEYGTNETWRAAMEGYTDLYVSGYRELLRTA